MSDAATAARTRRRVLASVLLATVPTSGCYRYVPAAGAPPAPGRTVRVSLTPAAQGSLAPMIGTGVVALEGDVVGATPDGLTLRVARLLTGARVPVAWTGGPVAVPTGAVATLERRELSRGRTALLVGGVALGALLLGAAVGSAASDGGGPNPGPIQP